MKSSSDDAIVNNEQNNNNNNTTDTLPQHVNNNSINDNPTNQSEVKQEQDNSNNNNNNEGNNNNNNNNNITIETNGEVKKSISSDNISSSSTPSVGKGGEGSFKSSLSSFLTNYGNQIPIPTPLSMISTGIKSSMSLITNNLPSPPSISILPNSFPSISNIPIISFVSNNIPFPISYNKNKDKSKQPTTQSNPTTTTTTTTTPTTTKVTTTNNEIMFEPLPSNIEDNIESYFTEITTRLSNSVNKHILATIDSYIDSINEQKQADGDDGNNQNNNNNTFMPMDDISTSTKSFIGNILPMLLHACAAMPFKSSPSSTTIASNQPRINLFIGLPNPMVMVIGHEYLENYITSRLYRRIFSSHLNIDIDTKLCEHISTFQFITPSNLDIDNAILSNQQKFEQIQEELLKMTSRKSPREKLHYLKNSFKGVFKLLTNDKTKENKEAIVMGADLLLPIIIYVLIKSNLPFLLSNLQFITQFRESSLIESETSYYLVTILTAATFIQNMTMDSLTFPSTTPPTDQDNNNNNNDDIKNTEEPDPKKNIKEEIPTIIVQKEDTPKNTNSNNTVNNNNNNTMNQDADQTKKQNYKFYKGRIEDLSVKELRLLLNEYNNLVDYWYSHSNNNSNNNNQ